VVGICSQMNTPQRRYEIIGTLGTGASSRVDKARDSTIGRTVALKTFLHGFGSGDVQKQFLREAQIIGRLTHPCIVSLYDVGTNPDDGLPYLVMEYVEGKTLERTLDAGPLPLERAAVWAADLASALARAHQCKIIHGDLKPANVLITSEGQVKLGDFGIARFATQVSASGSVLGTPAYLSPEQILGHKQDTRSDLFSLGIILYQMTTGVRPFDGTSVGAVCAQIVSAEPSPPSHHNPALPREFDHLVMRCLAKDPAKRYADAESLGASLYPFARSKPLPAPLSGPSWWKRPTQASDLLAAAGVLLGFAALGVGAQALHRHFSTATVRTDSSTPASAAQPLANTPGGADSSAALGSIDPAQLINVDTGELRAADAPTTSGAQEMSSAQIMSDSQIVAHGSSSEPRFAGAGSSTPPVLSATHAFERHALANRKSNATHSETGAPDAALSSSRTAAAPSPAGGPAPKSAVIPASKISLHIDIVSGVAEETVSVFAGDDLLLTAPLQAGHVGDTLRFDCPIAPGEHAFRVVLSRSDQTVLVEKQSTSQIRADASNFLGIHVSRHAKLLVKHETLLEVVWPSTIAPVTDFASPRPPGELAFR
jgi:serine/threonine protein kinase